MERESLGDKLQRWAELAVNIILLGFFWTLTSLGVVTVGAATTALNESMRACVVLKDTKPLKVFFKSFRENFKTSTLVWLIHLAVLVVLGVDLLWYSAGDTALDNVAKAAVCVLLTLVAFEMAVVFACIVQYRLTTLKEIFARAFDFAFRCFVESLEILIFTATVIVAGLFLLRGILPFAAGIIAALSWKILPGAFQKYHFKKPKQ